MSPELYNILQYLLPGIVSAVLLYLLLRNYRRQWLLGKIVQPLIIVFLGNAASLAWIDWLNFDASPRSGFLLTLGFTILFTLLAALCINNDIPNRWLRRKKNSPAEQEKPQWQRESLVVLHLKDGRHLAGLLEEYPKKQDVGIFIIKSASWIENNVQHGVTIDKIFIPARDVETVEFLEAMR